MVIPSISCRHHAVIADQNCTASHRALLASVDSAHPGNITPNTYRTPNTTIYKWMMTWIIC